MRNPIARIAYDLIGSAGKAVAVVDIYKKKNAKEIAREILRRHAHVKSVLGKSSGRAGAFRIYKLKFLAGSHNTEVLHKEHGFFFKLDPRKVYFSPRESEERARVAALVKPKEKILVLFSGIGPLQVYIGRACPSCEIIGVELNKAAVKYADKNLRLNKIRNAKNICGDARKVKFENKFDRIIMPLPESGLEFLPAALKFSRKGTVIQVYAISEQKNLFADVEKKISKILKKKKVKFRFIVRQKVLPYAPRLQKVRIDFMILRSAKF